MEMVNTYLWLVLFLALAPPVSALLPGVTTQQYGLQTLSVISGTISILKFALPVKNKDQWSEYNSELSQILKPLHSAIANDIVTPEVGGDQLTHDIQNFLLTKPEFNDNKKSSYVTHTSKVLEAATSIKNKLRKQAKQSKTPEDRKKFHQAIRAHNYIVKQEKLKDKHKTVQYQESLYHKDFWSFSKSVCTGHFGQDQVYPGFDVTAANNYYPNKYSSTVPLATENLHWFPYLSSRGHQTSFNLSPILPRDIRNIIQNKSNSSSPGPDGITYGLLKKLPCIHHILATLYNKILITGVPPTSWTCSKITLIYKKGDNAEPCNFRMIALSCTLGKIFHQIMATRTVDYMVDNHFIDNTIQKAFIHRVNGTIEHNILLQEIIQHAHANKKTLHISFFDLEDAFGSVSHELIRHCLHRYNFPQPVIQYIMALYGNLTGTVDTKSWQSTPFQFKKGIFQGDPWSPIIFLTVFNPLLERLAKDTNVGYNLNGTRILTTPFADDFNLITTHKVTHQKLINNISTWTKSMNLKLKPSKCRSLSLCGGKPKAVPFYIDGTPLSTLDESPHKFLGSTITFSGKQKDTYKLIMEHFKTKLQYIDSLLVRNEYKLKMFKDYLLPASRFILTVHELTQTSLKNIDSLTNSYLKKWSGLPRCATPSILHIDQFTGIKTVCELYEECHTTTYIATRMKGDNTVNHALDSKLNRESKWTHKSSTIVTSHSTMKKSVTKDNNNDPTLAKKTAKSLIHDKHHMEHWQHVISLAVQGEFCRIWDMQELDFTWKSIIHNLPRGVTKFLLNSVLKSLPTKDNLSKWGKVLSQECDLCGDRETAGHVLSGCKLMLEQGRYTWRHDSILNKISQTIKANSEDDINIYVDLNSSWTIPPDILPTSDRPDLVIINKQTHSISILELTVPFETNIQRAHEYKCHKYTHLILDLQSQGFSVKYFAIEVGCRGLLTTNNSKRLQAFFSSVPGLKLPSKDFRQLKVSLHKIAITTSFMIYKSKYSKLWHSCALLCDM